LKSHIFREYDIRGTVPDELNKEVVHGLGLAIGTYYSNEGVRRISLGRDCRLSSQDLSEGLIEGLVESGMEVIDLGMVYAAPLFLPPSAGCGRRGADYR
jgi:phosphomannomutase